MIWGILLSWQADQYECVMLGISIGTEYDMAGWSETLSEWKHRRGSRYSSRPANRECCLYMIAILVCIRVGCSHQGNM